MNSCVPNYLIQGNGTVYTIDSCYKNGGPQALTLKGVGGHDGGAVDRFLDCPMKVEEDTTSSPIRARPDDDSSPHTLAASESSLLARPAGKLLPAHAAANETSFAHAAKGQVLPACVLDRRAPPSVRIRLAATPLRAAKTGTVAAARPLLLMEGGRGGREERERER